MIKTTFMRAKAGKEYTREGGGERNSVSQKEKVKSVRGRRRK